MITLLVLTDGRRGYLGRTLNSFELSVTQAPIGRRVIVNDCPDDPEHEAWIDTLGFDTHLRPEPRRRGFAGAIAAGWEAVDGTDFVFHLEDDFIFTRHVDLVAMARVLDAHPYLTQMALRRQAWNDGEVAAGGVIEQHPDAYQDRSAGPNHWLEHRLFFTTNPSLYPRWIRDRSWPACAGSEGTFSLGLFEDPALRSGYWGRRTDDPWVLHIGVERTWHGF